MTPRRKPKRAPKRSPVKSTKTPRIKSNPLAEYQELIEKDGLAHITSLGAEDCSSNVRCWFTTGSFALDRLLNGKGVPAGRLTEFFGPAHVGKSTVLDHIMAACQRVGGIAVLADSEAARDKAYSTRIGVDADKLQLIEFDRGKLTIENVLDKIRLSADFWVSQYPDIPVVIGYDALGGTPTNEELEKRLGEENSRKKDEEGAGKKEHTQPGAAAKIMRMACRQLVGAIMGTKVAVVFCNHEYEKINVRGWGPKKETYGGDAIRLAATNRVELFNLGFIKRGDSSILGRQVGARLVKNRLGKPWGQTSFALIPGIGVDNSWDLFEGLRDRGIIVISGSWAAVNLDGEVIKFQGWPGFQEKCAADPTLFPRLATVYQQLLDKLEVPTDASVPVSVPKVQA